MDRSASGFAAEMLAAAVAESAPAVPGSPSRWPVDGKSSLGNGAVVVVVVCTRTAPSLSCCVVLCCWLFGRSRRGGRSPSLSLRRARALPSRARCAGGEAPSPTSRKRYNNAIFILAERGGRDVTH